MSLIVEYIDICAAVALAISGALRAMQSKLDPFGVLIIGFITAVGGGTLRDVLLENRHVFWMVDPSIIYFITTAVIIAILFRKRLIRIQKVLFLFDTIGLGLYTVTGVQIGLDYDIHKVGCIILGVITGSFGGVIRDILVNEVPVIFRKEIYATVSIIGGALFVLLAELDLRRQLLLAIPIGTIILLRILIVKYKVSLPSFYVNSDG